MIIDCISDLHGHYPQLDGGDLLIVAGDLTKNGTLGAVNRFKDWIWDAGANLYKKVVMIAGNHDNCIEDRTFFNEDKRFWEHPVVSYLEDTGTEFEGLKIWGSPWTAYFEGMNPHCMAFTINAGCDTDDWLAEKWALIPEDTDILITHSPIKGILDKTVSRENVGSLSLKMAIWRMEKPPKLIVTGHIHEGYGIHREIWYQYSEDVFEQIIVNASHVNERYEPVNKPIRIEI